MKGQLPVFVYGTLLEGFSNYERYVKPYRHEIIPATIRGSVYHLPQGYPGLLDGSDTVKGGVLLFSPDDYEAAMEGLDKLETYFGPGDPRNEYERIEAAAQLCGRDERMTVYVYRYVDETYVKSRGTYVKGGDWHSFMQHRQAE